MNLGDLLSRHPLPDLSGGKDESGTILIIGGPATCPGAAMLAAEAALRVGAGRVQLVVDATVAAATAVARPEVLVLAWDRDGDMPASVAERVEEANVVVIGPGCDRVDPAVVAQVAARTRGALVLDAGAIAAATRISSPTLVLAPNAAEAATIADADTDDVAALARNVAQRLGVAIAVRGVKSAVSDGIDTWEFDDAPPGLGTPGSGDVFCGVLAGMLAAGLPPRGALGWAVELHAAAGAHLAARTPVGYLASDLVGALPSALSTHL